MSLFGGLMGDFDDDPFFGGQMRRMNNMMNSMMSDFFGGPPFGNMITYRAADVMDPYQRSSQDLVRRGNDFGMGMMPFGFGFPDMRNVFDMANNENCHSFSSSTVMTMTSGPDGRPQVYQASTSTRQAPGGVRETKKTVADSRTGYKKMSIGHHIGDRAHVMEKSQNVYSGEQEENQEFINLDEEEADDFNREWETKARTVVNPALTYGGTRHSHHHHHHHHSNRRHRGDSTAQLALPPAPSTNAPGVSSSLSRHSSRQAHRTHYPQLLPPPQNTNYKSEKMEVGKKRKQHCEESTSNGQTERNKGGGNKDEEEDKDEGEPRHKKRAPSINLPDETNSDEDSSNSD